MQDLASAGLRLMLRMRQPEKQAQIRLTERR